MNGKSWIMVMLINILPLPPPEQTKLPLQAHETGPRWPCPWDNVALAVTVIYEEIRCHRKKRLNCASAVSGGVLWGLWPPASPLHCEVCLQSCFPVYITASPAVWCSPGLKTASLVDGAGEPSAWSRTGT